MDRQNYFKQAWGLLTRDKGWIKPLLVMSIANCVPIVGFLGVNGYVQEWARLTAWGVDSAPKQKNVQVGKCISSGWRAFVVSLGMGLCVGAFFGIFQGLFSLMPEEVGGIFISLLGLVQSLFMLFYGVFFGVCAIRTSIYEQIGAGYRVDRVFEMIKRDTTGFAKIVLFSFIASMIFFVVLMVLICVAAIVFVPLVIAAANGASEEMILSILAQSLVGIVLLLILFFFVFSVVLSFYNMILYTMIALWMRQFDVPSWGKSSDPLPASATQDTSHSKAPVQPQRVEVQQSVPVPTPQKEDESTAAKPQEPVQGAEDSITPAFNPVQDGVPNVNAESDWDDGDDDQTLVYDSDFESEDQPEPEILTPNLEHDVADEQPSQAPAEHDPEIDDLYKRLDGIMHSDDE